ncbi:MAG: N-6 DNA methylase [Desulfobacterales bacterium]|nr:N-6 DNA methylase [Desulfobacterales bacterium]
MLDKETRQRINSARQILVGKVPDPKAQVEQITNALIYKFMDDMDRENEELGGKAQFLTGDLKEFSWGRLMSRELSGLERWDIYTRALSSFAKSKQIPELFRTIFKDAYLPYRDSETLNLFLKEINGFSYSNSENLGNAFEYLLSILGSQGDAGQFRTPRHVIDFIVEVVNPKKTDRILDPACGTAGFLISSYKHIRRENSSNYKAKEYVPTFAETESADITTVEIQKNGKYRGDKLNPDDRKRLGHNIVGYDISPDMVRLSLVNLYLHNFSTPQIYEYDTLTYEERWGDNFDIILANPPFMTPKGGIRPHKLFQVSANRAEVLFVDYIAEHLSINGKAGIIIPEGIIFQSANAYKALRKMLMDENYLYAVVSLPAGVFRPYSGVKTSILFIDKMLAKKSDEILFVKVENDGFDLGTQRRRIDKNDLPHAFKILRNWQKGEKTESRIAQWVKKEKIAANGDYNLTGDRYKEAVDYSKVKWPMVKLGEVCDFINGRAFKPKDWEKKENGGLPIIRIQNLNNPKAEFNYYSGDVAEKLIAFN